MTPKEKTFENEKALQNLEEICENTRAIRRVVNRILDHLHETHEGYEDEDYDLDTLKWEDLYNHDDMYY
jgi:hypothetical protein